MNNTIFFGDDTNFSGKNFGSSMREKNILIVDSGNGGKYTLSLLRRFLPVENFVYIEDNKNCPYGKKSKHRLKKICKDLLTSALKIYPAKIIVIACNTMSSVIDDKFKSKFKMPILTVTPKIKNYKKPTLVLCTSATRKYNKDIKNYSKSENIEICDFKDLAKKIDENVENLTLLQPYLDKKLKKYAKMNIRRVVLGCTHFNLIKTQIQNSLINNPLVPTPVTYKTVAKKSAQTLPIVLTNKKPDVIFYESSKDVALLALNTLKALSLQSKRKAGSVLYLKTQIE